MVSLVVRGGFRGFGGALTMGETDGALFLDTCILLCLLLFLLLFLDIHHSDDSRYVAEHRISQNIFLSLNDSIICSSVTKGTESSLSYHLVL